MKISQLIDYLLEFQKDHGDLECIVEDGGDPSDRMPGECVYFMPKAKTNIHVREDAAYISSD